MTRAPFPAEPPTGRTPFDAAHASLELWHVRLHAAVQTASDQELFARTRAAAVYGQREDGDAETWDRMAPPEEVRQALLRRPPFGQRWRRLWNRWTRRRGGLPEQTGSCGPPALARGPTDLPTPSGTLEVDDQDRAGWLPVPVEPPRSAVDDGVDAVLRSLDLRSANRLELLRSLPAPLGDWRSEALTLSLSPTGRPPPMRLGAGTSPAPERSPTLPDDACTLPAVSLRRRQARLEARGARAEPGSRSERKSWPISLGRLGRDRRVGVAGAILLLVVSMAGIESGRDRLHGWWAQLETAVSGSGGTSPGAGDAIPALEIARLAAQDDPDLASLVGEAVRAPGRWQPFYELGQALRLRGDLPAAIHMYREASRLSPGDPASAFALGYVLQLQGEYAAASEQYQAAIRLDPNHAPAFYNLGMLFQRVGEWGEALEHYRRAAALSLSGGPGPDTRRRVAENSQRPPAPQGR